MSRVDRLVYLTKKLGGDTYVNNDSGKNLYSEEIFKEKDISLLFFEANIKLYKQKSKNQKFIPLLSILDILMNCSKRECLDLLQTSWVSYEKLRKNEKCYWRIFWVWWLSKKSKK